MPWESISFNLKMCNSLKCGPQFSALAGCYPESDVIRPGLDDSDVFREGAGEG